MPWFYHYSIKNKLGHQDTKMLSALEPARFMEVLNGNGLLYHGWGNSDADHIISYSITN